MYKYHHLNKYFGKVLVPIDEEEEKDPASVISNRTAKDIEKNNKFITLRETDSLLYFDFISRQYHDDDSFLNEIVRKELGRYYSTAALKEITAMIKVDTYMNSNEFKCSVEWINLRNGAFNLRT